MTTTKIPAIERGTVRLACQLETTTVGELGDVLPFGLPGKIGRTTFRLHRPRLKIRKRIGELKTRKALRNRPGLHVAYYCAKVLAELDGVNFDTIKEDEAAAMVSRLSTGDVLFLMFRWQALASRNGVSLSGHACRACGLNWESFTLPIGDLGVQRALPPGDGVEAPSCVVGLLYPLETDRGTVSTVYLEPPTWGETFGTLTADTWANSELTRAKVIESAIKLTDVGPLLKTDDLDDLDFDDVDLIDQALDDCTPSVDPTTEFTCPKCGTEQLIGADWRSIPFS